MKYSYALPLLAVAVYAQEPTDFPVPPLSEVRPDLVPYAQALATVNTSVIALDDGVIAFAGPSDVQTVLGDSTDLYNTIVDQTAAIQTLPVIDGSDLIALINGPAAYVVSLGYWVDKTVRDLVNKKQTFVDACAGPLVLQQIQSQSSVAAVFSSLFIAKLPESLSDIGVGLASTIPVALASGIAAYADQTTTPTCSTSTTSTGGDVSTTTTTAAPGGSTTTGGVYPTTSVGGVYPTTTGGGVYPTTSVGGVYPTTTVGGVYPTTTQGSIYSTTTSSDDCEDDSSSTTTAAPTVYPTTTRGSVYSTTTSSEDCEDDSSSTTTAAPTVYPTTTRGSVYSTTTSSEDCEDDSSSTTTVAPTVYPTTPGASTGWQVITTTSDDCEDDTTPTPTPTGPHGSHTTSPSNPDDDDDDCEPDDTYPTTTKGGSGSGPSSGWSAITTAPAVPGTSTPVVAPGPVITTKAFPGAAAANNVNQFVGMGVAALIAGALL